MLKDILSISGQPGLFKLVSQAKNSIIVESLIDGKRMPVYSTSRISALEDISIYTNEGEEKLTNVLVSLFENKTDVNPKASSNILKETFEKLLPNYDSDRVYTSDIKKVFSWYLLLIDKNIINDEAIKTYKESLEKDNAEEEKEEEEEEKKEKEETKTDAE